MTTTKEKPNVIELHLEKCLSDVCEITGVQSHEIMSRQRGFNYICDARFLVYCTLKAHELDPPFSQIGRIMGRDHGAIMNGIKQIKNRASYCKKMKAKVKALRERGHRI